MSQGKGKVYLVGAGPGDVGLITLRGLECLQEADVILYDRLANPALLRYAKEGAEVIYVGKKATSHPWPQEAIHALMAEKAREGKIVCRLKGGDPFVYGRGGEEALFLAEEGIPFEVVPGVTSATAVPAYAGIPITHRAFCSALGVVAGHRAPGEEAPEVRWEALAQGLDTIVVLMGMAQLPHIVASLLQHGRSPQTPVALIRWGTYPRQETVVGTLADIVEKAQRAGLRPPVVAVIGEVVRLRERMRWYDNRPLFGKRILVTRARHQAPELSRLLEQRGAEVVEFPVLRFEALDVRSTLEPWVRKGLCPFDWLLFTSPNGARFFFQQLREMGRDARWLGRAKVGVIGPGTAAALEAWGIRPDFTPSRFIAEALAEEFPEEPKGQRILLARAAQAREVLPQRLRERGAEVVVLPLYRTLPDGEGKEEIERLLREGRLDGVTFTSSSTVEHFHRLLPGVSLEGLVLACIGPITAQTLARYGWKAHVVAEEHSLPGLVEALERHWGDGP